jgi:hypothetical protein
MIYPGTDIKFRITTEIPDFQLSEGNFRVVVKDRYGRVVASLTKNDCFYDDQGQFYFTIEKVRCGWHFAFFTAYREDEDYDDLTAAYTDSQPLCCVGYCEKHAPQIHDCDEDHHKVHYEQVWSVSIDGEDYLADCDGNYVLTSDGNRICFKSNKQEIIDDMGKVRMKMTGDEFLQFMEGRDRNGEINTIPELMDAAHGISDDGTTIKGEIEDEMDENTPERVTPEDLANFEI